MELYVFCPFDQRYGFCTKEAFLVFEKYFSVVKRLLSEYSDYFAGELFMLLTVANSISWPRISVRVSILLSFYIQLNYLFRFVAKCD